MTTIMPKDRNISDRKLPKEQSQHPDWPKEVKDNLKESNEVKKPYFTQRINFSRIHISPKEYPISQSPREGTSIYQ